MKALNGELLINYLEEGGGSCSIGLDRTFPYNLIFVNGKKEFKKITK